MSRKNEITDTVADISKARKELGWEPKVSFTEGIGRIVESMEVEKPDARNARTAEH